MFAVFDREGAFVWCHVFYAYKRGVEGVRVGRGDWMVSCSVLDFFFHALGHSILRPVPA